MTIRRDRMMPLWTPKPRLLREGDFIEWKGRVFIVRSHSRWHCWAVPHVPPNPNAGRVLAEAWHTLCENYKAHMDEQNRRYAEEFA